MSYLYFFVSLYLGAVEDVDKVKEMSESGCCLGLMVVVGAPVGPISRSPRPVEPLKIMKIAKESSGPTSLMKGALFIKGMFFLSKIDPLLF